MSAGFGPVGRARGKVAQIRQGMDKSVSSRNPLELHELHFCSSMDGSLQLFCMNVIPQLVSTGGIFEGAPILIINEMPSPRSGTDSRYELAAIEGMNYPKKTFTSISTQAGEDVKNAVKKQSKNAATKSSEPHPKFPESDKLTAIAGIHLRGTT